MTTRLRIASYNTRDFLNDPLAAARVVRALDPDVLCLQEVPRRLFATTRVATFAEHCGMYWSGTHRGSGGTAILTSLRVQVVESRHHRLQVARLQRTRGFAVIRVAAEGGPPLAVASVHLSLDADERLRHAQHILAALDVAGDVVLAGDLNESEEGQAWQALLARPLALISPVRPTFSARYPRRMLDVIFGSAGVTVLPHVDVALGRDDLVAASDHLPTWVDIEV
jgi:endonuclease/exonuclease/phosphatase family metal-dependent hydrolase